MQIAIDFAVEVKIKEQERRLRNTELILNDLANISETMPLLLSYQAENVFKAETRFNEDPTDEDPKKGFMLTDGTGTGKAQALDSKILTPSGWKLMGNISVGDKIIGSDGKVHYVNGVYPQGLKKMYKVTFSDNSSTKCCEDHLWLTQTLYQRRKYITHPKAQFTQPKVKSLKEISETIHQQYFIPMIESADFYPQKITIDPYVLGVLIGDGCFTGFGLTFTVEDVGIAAEMAKNLQSYLVHKQKEYKNKATTYTIRDHSQTGSGGKKRHGLIDHLRSMNMWNCLSYEKFIPQQYKFNSKEVRISLLQGLFDTDGTVDRRSKSASYCTTSKVLAEDVQFIIQSLGGVATVNSKKTNFTHKGIKKAGRIAYNVHFNLPEGIIPFRLRRKADQYRPKYKYSPKRKISSIEFVGIEEAQCISVSAPNSLYVTDDCIVTHNTFSGLGLIKRFTQRGLIDILIVVPTDIKVKDWIKDARYFGLALYQLKDIKDAGRLGGIIITTYANFRQNEAILLRARKRPFNLVVYDESHNLIMNGAGIQTDADLQHKRITFSYNQALYYANEKYTSLIERDMEKFNRISSQTEEIIIAETERLTNMTKVLFLSATPFSYHKNLSYADGYLYYIKEGQEKPSEAYNTFYVNNFGYRLMSNKLCEPDAKVDVGMLERKFHTKLTKNCAISTTKLKLDYDYSREFVLVDNGLGYMIDEGYTIVSNKDVFPNLSQVIERKFSGLYVSQLLECMKAKKAVDRVKQHLALGRKVVVFHTFINAMPDHPFHVDVNKDKALMRGLNEWVVQRELRLFNEKYPQYANLDISGLKPPGRTFFEAFGDKCLFFNGTVDSKDRVRYKTLFNKDDSGCDLMVIQLQAGKEGISVHDTTGLHQRVICNLALPVRPSDAGQSEGRIYRFGQKSDAVFEYFVLHLEFEKMEFGLKINERVSTVENLAFGDASRNMKDAFKEGYNAPVTDAPHLLQGKGGSASDMVFEKLAPHEMAIKFYDLFQKRTARNKSANEIDYYPTPEPIGLCMVNWLCSKAGDNLCEPSAGHGAIARFFPEDTTNKYIEPSLNLKGDLAINISSGHILSTTWELHNHINKYDGIVMNPPFGTNAATAWNHLMKAMKHVTNSARIIAIMPSTLTMPKRFEAWRNSSDSENFFITARIYLPGVTFSRTGTEFPTEIVIIDYQRVPGAQREMPKYVEYDLRHISNVYELFEKIREIKGPDRIRAEYTAGTYSGVMRTINRMSTVAVVVPNIHTKTQIKLFTVRLSKTTNYVFMKAKEHAKTLNGYYSEYSFGGAIPGFIFKEQDNGKYKADLLAEYINKTHNESALQ